MAGKGSHEQQANYWGFENIDAPIPVQQAERYFLGRFPIYYPGLPMNAQIYKEINTRINYAKKHGNGKGVTNLSYERESGYSLWGYWHVRQWIAILFNEKGYFVVCPLPASFLDQSKASQDNYPRFIAQEPNFSKYAVRGFRGTSVHEK